MFDEGIGVIEAFLSLALSNFFVLFDIFFCCPCFTPPCAPLKFIHGLSMSSSSSTELTSQLSDSYSLYSGRFRCTFFLRLAFLCLREVKASSFCLRNVRYELSRSCRPSVGFILRYLLNSLACCRNLFQRSSEMYKPSSNSSFVTREQSTSSPIMVMFSTGPRASCSSSSSSSTCHSYPRFIAIMKFCSSSVFSQELEEDSVAESSSESCPVSEEEGSELLLLDSIANDSSSFSLCLSTPFASSLDLEYTDLDDLADLEDLATSDLDTETEELSVSPLRSLEV
mmetsp:Transcript_2098/g.6404  ORF Transcript_2098/g.6404 Transcript_2098/m.6404 type:complete len:283 (-) Transcript_2098:138-986(-)